jgi:uncharacterized membrane protein
MRLTIKILAIVVGCLVAYFGYWQYQYKAAESAAGQFCAAVADGSDLSDAIARAEGIKGVRHGFADPKVRYVVMFKGPIFNAFVCELTVADAKVTSRRVTALED